MIRKVLFVFVTAALAIACSKNPITGRSSSKLFPESLMQSIGASEYQSFLSSNKVVNSSVNRDVDMVRRVGQRVSKAVTNYYNSKGLGDLLKGYNWEYSLVESKDINAWCLPGGKIVIYTGLLPVSQNEAALAVIMGHEVSHAIFNHANERLTMGTYQGLFGAGLEVAMQDKPAETRNAYRAVFGIGTAVGVLLPFSRKHELEADHWGLNWAAMAGYNPQEGIALWQRMEKASNGNKPPEFLSTHPSETNRIEQLQKFMPEAMKFYKPMGN